MRKANEELEQLIMNDINIFITDEVLASIQYVALLILNLKEVKLHLAYLVGRNLKARQKLMLQFIGKYFVRQSYICFGKLF